MDVEKTIEFILNSQAQSEARLGRLRMDQLTERMETIAQQSEERDRQLGQRIESLVIAIGEFIRNRPITG
jgi:hypothetical protein